MPATPRFPGRAAAQLTAKTDSCSSTARPAIRSTSTSFPEDVYNSRKIDKIFGVVERRCFQGHTHVPGVFTRDKRFLCPADINNQFVLGEDKTMVNVGSVGQPRDGNPRSCYVLLDDNVVQFRRVEYPFEKTIEKIYAIPELDNFLGDRLREGR